MAITIILLIGVLYASVWTVMTTRLIRAVVGLAVTSAMLSIVMFRFNSSLAAVFELSVCAGLIFVIFITTVSFTARLSQEEYQQRKRTISKVSLSAHYYNHCRGTFIPFYRAFILHFRA